ncbi:Crp/Fnr family transcriptional regulator [Bosea psychrotolerans]|uniref:CRP/FNR family transcriptional regulator n=1 Tax=Bosea psychrotolerans TaxID=1871628 RepID=A0A2S4LXG1_9HYPH|nr:helix-turn-helix domain-containing protein [Bosea psychrotolerans]POR47126.1 CRP/FNR family transcriptional regulator [Bosea psychrotolerans]
MFTETIMSQRPGFVSAIADTTPPALSLQALFSKQAVETFEGGSAVFWEGDSARHVFEVVEGVLRVFKITGDGHRVITGFIYPGDLLGVSLKDRYLYTAEAVTKTKLRRFTRRRFQEEINQSPELRPQLFARLCDEMAAAQDQMVLLARKSAEERVSSFLLVIARRLSSDQLAQPIVEIPMTRLDMADYLGLTIETVSRTMTKLISAGVIAPSGRHSVIVRKPAKLARLAGEGDDDDKQTWDQASIQQAIWPQ